MGFGPFRQPFNIHSATTRWNEWQIPATAVLPTHRLSPALAGSVVRVNGSAHVIDTCSGPQNGVGAIAANRVVEIGPYSSQAPSATASDVEFGLDLAWRIVRMSMLIQNDGALLTGAGAGDCFIGFELGTLGRNAPWAGLTSLSNCIQVRWYQKGARNQIGLVTANLGELPNEVLTTLADAPQDNTAHLFELEARPLSHVRLWLTPNNSGPRQLVCEQLDPAKIPNGFAIQTLHPHYGLVQNTGSNAAGRFQACGNWHMAVSAPIA